MPWNGKEDVARHNKKCSQYGACRKLWLRTANDYYARTGDDGQAVIRANVAAKKWLLSHGKYRRNMDESLRNLERKAATGDEGDAARYRNALVRAGIIPPEMPEGGLWVNAYVDNQARASLHAATYDEVTRIIEFLDGHFTPRLAAEYETYDVALRQDVIVPQELLQISTEESPAFDFDEGEAWPRPFLRGREPYVGLVMVDSIDDLQPPPDREEEDDVAPVEDVEEDDDLILHWVNVYTVDRVFGSPAEGGTWYNHEEPIGCLYIGDLYYQEISQDRIPPHIQAAHDFFAELYGTRAYGDIYSTRGGVQIRINNEEGPARRTEPYRYE